MDNLKNLALECFNDENWNHIQEKSYYCHNFYKCSNGQIVYAESDDDNTTDYYLVVGDNKYGYQFAYSLTSRDDELVWYAN